jgi:hypothetical protein
VDRPRLEEDAEGTVVIDLEETLTRHLSRRASSARPVDDVAAVIDERVVIELCPIRPRNRARRTIALAAAVAAIAVGVAALRTSTDSSGLDVAGAGAETCYVFMHLDAGDAEIIEIGEQLSSRPEVVDLRLMTKEKTYEEVMRMFAGKADIVSLMTPEVFPASWRFALEPDAAPVRRAIVRDFGPNPAVKNVSCADAARGSRGTTHTGPPSTGAGATSASAPTL